MRGCRFLEAELQDRDRILAGRYVLTHPFHIWLTKLENHLQSFLETMITTMLKDVDTGKYFITDKFKNTMWLVYSRSCFVSIR